MTRSVLMVCLALATPGAAFAAPSAQLEVPGGAKRFDYRDEAVYPVIATPGRITDIILEPGENLVGSGPVAAGDTARWVIGDTISGQGGQRRVHVMIKPTASGLATNLVINTDRRTYHLELRASPRTWLSQVAWRYADPAPAAPALAPIGAPSPGPIVPPVQPERPLNFAYKISGPHPNWRPVAVSDDSQRVFVDFGPAVAMDDLPPLYRIGPDGKTAELINYRVEGRRIVVERLFDRAELRLGAKRASRVVRIIRTTPIQEAGR
ncbi:P-type conjugative transfer protein TrbG [Caulobacter hibisci]|uniref:P-type conjugative transfer protein TrbG n=1 Tax=Caulobacter hibisci TaxID=2035993 RepID=A0ABS0T589_9CAUL|nr:P-type conjugative transfer protein TrbG [Caulobacter hibisci]MBI1687047.1 P-type conjugative transfer protein TrbG [Caulobacter hibisci]